MTDGFQYLTPRQHARFERVLSDCTYCQLIRLIFSLSRQATIAHFHWDQNVALVQLQQVWDELYRRLDHEVGLYSIRGVSRDGTNAVSPRETRQGAES